MNITFNNKNRTHPMEFFLIRLNHEKLRHIEFIKVNGWVKAVKI